jgi:hypothetical protein
MCPLGSQPGRPGPPSEWCSPQAGHQPHNQVSAQSQSGLSGDTPLPDSLSSNGVASPQQGVGQGLEGGPQSLCCMNNSLCDHSQPQTLTGRAVTTCCHDCGPPPRRLWGAQWPALGWSKVTWVDALSAARGAQANTHPKPSLGNAMATAPDRIGHRHTPAGNHSATHRRACQGFRDF